MLSCDCISETPVAQTRSKPATYAAIEALPAHLVGEIAFGVLHTHPRPAPRHGRASTRIASELDGPFDRGRNGPGGWILLAEPELHLGPHVLVPDIAGWRRERMPKLPNTAFIETVPNWACEVLSPSTQRFDRTDKLAIYATFEVDHCWYVDPNARTLEVFQRQNDKWLLAHVFKDADAVTAPPFDAHTFALDLLWSDTTG
jgi:Uma2 family endonuclease